MNPKDDRILDCGHKPSPHGESTTGTAHTPDKKEICWDCSLASEVENLKTVLHYGAYLSGDGKRITAWPGGLLMNVTKLHWKYVGFSQSKRYYIQATDVHGQQWYGNSPGPDMFARMHRHKAKRRN